MPRREVDRFEDPADLHLDGVAVDLVERSALDPLDGILARLALEDPVARDELLRLGEGPVDDGG